MRSVAYFGCLRGTYGHDSAGHHLYLLRDGHPKMLSWTAYDLIPWGKGIDSSLAPCVGPTRYSAELEQGKALLHQEGDWTAISFWDCSGDSRRASNSAFLVEEKTSFDDLLTRARETWVPLFDRFPFEVTQVVAPCRLEDPRRNKEAA